MSYATLVRKNFKHGIHNFIWWAYDVVTATVAEQKNMSAWSHKHQNLLIFQAVVMTIGALQDAALVYSSPRVCVVNHKDFRPFLESTGTRQPGG